MLLSKKMSSCFFCFLFLLFSTKVLFSKTKKHPKRTSYASKSFASKPKYVFLISIDGLGFEHLKEFRKKMPHLSSMMAKGVWGDAVASFPSMTWSSHATIISGQSVRHHGILGNQWITKHKDWIKPFRNDITEVMKSNTLFDVMKKHKIKQAALAWPGTQGMKGIDFHLPEVYSNYYIRKYMKGRKDPILRFLKKLPMDPFYLARIMYTSDLMKDLMIRDLTEKLIQLSVAKRPQFYAIHLFALDHWLHEYGGSVTSRRVVSWVIPFLDQILGDLLVACRKRGILHESQFVIVSDHGFAEATQTIDIRQILVKAKISKHRYLTNYKIKREKVVGIRNGHAAFLYVRKSSKQDKRNYNKTIASIQKELKKIKEIERILLPKDYHSVGFPLPSENDGSPDLIAVSEIGSYFRSNPKGVLVQKNVQWGMHGYFPNHPKMKVPFVFYGAGVQPSPHKQYSIQNMDIAPTIAHSMGLTWPKGKKREGNILHNLLMNPPKTKPQANKKNMK